MARGRKRIPDSIRILKGDFKRGHEHLGAPKFTGSPRCPTWLSVDAKVEWKRIVPKLVELGIATEADQAALIAYCEACSLLKTSTKTIQVEGLTVERANGLVKHPALAAFNEASKAIVRIASEFGLTPASRSKVRGKPVEKKSALDEFMRGA